MSGNNNNLNKQKTAISTSPVFQQAPP